MVSGTILLLLSMIFSTVSFAAPNLRVPAAPAQADQTCSEASPPECAGHEVGYQFYNAGGQCKMCDADSGAGGPTVHCHIAACEGPECTVDGDCDDGNACNGDETCSGGSCQAGTPLDCNDGDVCTDDSCDPASGCVYTDNTNPCDDGDICTESDQCSAGVCDGVEKDCSALDGACVEGVCNPASGACQASNLPAGTSCSDGDPCTDPDQCDGAGLCAPGPDICGECETPDDCPSGNACQTPTCVDNVCGFDDIPDCCLTDAQCDDSDICTTDACVGNTCDHTPVAPRSCYTGPAGTEGVGICTGGTQSCSNDEWGACEGEVTPGTEVCDAAKLDEDCNGSQNEGCTCDEGDTMPCGTDEGECVAGTQTCDSTGTWGECEGAIGPATEICDGLDNDCDGSTDEGLGTTTCGVGECQVTVDNCVDGELQECVPGTPVTEICGDKLDNDCDGSVDEGCREPPDRGEPTPPEVPTPAPTPTVVIEVLGVEELPVTGIPPVGPVLPTLPMTLSALALMAGGLILRETDKKK
jgi:hypothetical protein